MFATRRRSFGSPTRAEALVLGQNCASLVTKITILVHVKRPCNPHRHSIKGVECIVLYTVGKVTEMSSQTAIETIVEELDSLINLANEGEDFDEDRMDQLLRQRDEHPEYIKRITEEKILFREQLEPFLYRYV